MTGKRRVGGSVFGEEKGLWGPSHLCHDIICSTSSRMTRVLGGVSSFFFFCAA